jgi:DNA polymerase-4
VKLKFADFSQTTAEQTGRQLTAAAYTELLGIAFERGQRPVRLVGVGVRLADEADQPQQLPLFECRQAYCLLASK